MSPRRPGTPEWHVYEAPNVALRQLLNAGLGLRRAAKAMPSSGVPAGAYRVLARRGFNRRPQGHIGHFIDAVLTAGHRGTSGTS